MTPTEALAACVGRVTTAGILPGGCHYPPQPAPAPRSGQLLWEGTEAAYFHEHVWIQRWGLYLVAPKLNESTWDVAALDPLVTAVADLFSPANPDAYHLRTVLDPRGVDHCAYAGDEARPDFRGYYARRVALEVKIRRAAAVIPS